MTYTPQFAANPHTDCPPLARAWDDMERFFLAGEMKVALAANLNPAAPVKGSICPVCACRMQRTAMGGWRCKASSDTEHHQRELELNPRVRIGV